MLREKGPDDIIRNDASVLTTGTYDGVHRGHQAIVKYLVERAKVLGGIATVVTFDPHPREVIGTDRIPILSTIEERAEMLEALGLDRFVVLPFTRGLSMLEPEAYVEDVLLKEIGLQEIVIGYDHRFGRNRAGDRLTLERLGRQHGFSVDVIPKQIVTGITVSSTQIRNALSNDGDVELAAQLLGRRYALSGMVVKGAQRGQTIGFPTANIQPEHPKKLIPKPGVYAIRATTETGKFGGMMNIGRRPTFETDGQVHLEAHLFGFDGNLYGTMLRVEFVSRLRDEQKFDGVEALVERLHEDRKQAEGALTNVF
ncbi:MAG: bifunctional riboflavin kinase/FAD synthetase [Rubricoccaceae bacterium]|nr:bifunctional riboflavin kinase/FAD synthetase [Rubricoccaceae bacterium]